MLSRLIVLVLFCRALVLASRVRINNYCQKELLIIEAKSPYGSSTPLCKLTADFSCYKDYTANNTWLYFKNGYGNDATLVEIIILRSGTDSRDSYLIITRFGFDLPLQLSSNTGPTFTCADPKCPDSYDNNDKYGVVATGEVITINYCPYNMEVFAANGLRLVETIHN